MYILQFCDFQVAKLAFPICDLDLNPMTKIYHHTKHEVPMSTHLKLKVPKDRQPHSTKT